MISYVIATRDRPDALDRTLRELGRLGDHHHVGGAEVLVIDDASAQPASLPLSLSSGLPIHLVRVEDRRGAAARNLALDRADPRSDWLVMLDDDSVPVDATFAGRLAAQPRDVAAVAADIFVPDPHTGRARREWGGLPEVFIGCGVALRRRAFAAAGGYDPAFGYYAEEYDLSARFLRHGQRVHFDAGFRIIHRRTHENRNADIMLENLVRNNGWVIERYAPASARPDARLQMLRRCREIARREHALNGLRRGLRALRATRARQSRAPLAPEIYARFTGEAHASAAIALARQRHGFRSAALVEPGKNAWAIERAARACGVRLLPPTSLAAWCAPDDRARARHDGERPDALLIGTLSPGPMLDALEALAQAPLPVVAPWLHAAEATRTARAA